MRARRDTIAILALLTVVTILIALLPLGRLGVAALLPSGRFDIGPFWAEVTSKSALAATSATLETAVVSAVAALLIGAAFAITLAVSDVRGKRLLAMAMVASLLIAPQVMALAFKGLAGPGSPLLNAIGLAPPPGTPNPFLGRFGVIVVLALHHAPLVAITVAVGLRAIPAALIDAARIDGATSASICRWLVLPLIRPHLLAGLALAFVAAAGNFGIPALLGLPTGFQTITTLIYRRLTTYGPSALGDAASLSMLLVAMVGLTVLAVAIALRHTTTRLEAGDRLRPFWALGPKRALVEAGLWAIVAISLVVPLAALLATALVPALGVRLSLETATLENFREVLFRQAVTTRALRNSFLLSAAAASICGGLAVVIAFGLDRYAGRARPLFEAVIEMPYALPGIVLAVAMILLLLHPLPLIGVSLYATPWIILAAYIARFLPQALKAPAAAVAQLSIDQEEAAALDGAGAWRRLRHVVVPQVLPAAAAGALLVFMTAFNELTVSALLWSAGTETLGVALFSLEEAGLAPAAAAVGLTAVAVVMVVIVCTDRLAPLLPADVLPWQALASTASADRPVSMPLPLPPTAAIGTTAQPHPREPLP